MLFRSVSETIQAIDQRVFDNWVNNVMTWGVGAGTAERSVTNDAWVANGVLGKYTAGAVGVYKCPADFSYVTIGGKRYPRIRSMSMSQAVGGPGGWLPPPNYDESQKRYKVFYKTADFNAAGSANVYVLIDEHPDGIADSRV